MTDNGWLAFFLGWVLAAVIVGVVARNRVGYSPLTWFAYALFLSPLIALIVLLWSSRAEDVPAAVIPAVDADDGHRAASPQAIQAAFCPRCGTPRAGGFQFCAGCGLAFDGLGPPSQWRQPPR